MQTITMREAVILRVLSEGDLYGLQIMEQTKQRTGQALPLGALYTTLDRMKAKGFIDSYPGTATHERGGNRRRMFTATASGMGAYTHFCDLARIVSSQPILTLGAI